MLQESENQNESQRSEVPDHGKPNNFKDYKQDKPHYDDNI
jgi:hypothetical protein